MDNFGFAKGSLVMIITPKETNIAYRCPKCGQGVKSVVGIFSLTGDKLKLKCPCGGSALDIDRTRDNKYMITAPCVMCGTDHKFTIAASSFFEKELFTYPCTYTGVDCCFIGLADKVSEALDNNEKEVIELYKRIGVEDPAEMLHGEYGDDDDDEKVDIEDTDVLDSIMFVLRDLLDTDSIKCNCNEPDYDFTLCDGYIKVFCRNCGASADIPARGRHDAESFLECYELKLK